MNSQKPRKGARIACIFYMGKKKTTQSMVQRAQPLEIEQLKNWKLELKEQKMMQDHDGRNGRGKVKQAQIKNK